MSEPESGPTRTSEARTMKGKIVHEWESGPTGKAP
jgi:hypothetical protein